MLEAIDLGGALAKICTEHEKIHYHYLTIVEFSQNGENYYAPAQNTIVEGKHNIIKLRDALLRAYPLED